MKKLINPNRRRKINDNGFTLVMTVSMMVLLALIAIGMLSLSSITLRASGQADAMAKARANAKLALMLALGDLQKYAGTDQSITATADILGANVVNPRMAGVWSSNIFDETNPLAPPISNKNSKFRGYITSAANQSLKQDPAYANLAINDPVKLWDRGSLGSVNPSPLDVVQASKVRVTVGNTKGAMAYGALDEGVKVRINTEQDSASAISQGAQISQLGSGVRPNTAGITVKSGPSDGASLAGLTDDTFEVSSSSAGIMRRGVSQLNTQLAAETIAAGSANTIKALTHDVSSVSSGLFTDVARGGLKEDFQLLTNGAALPDKYRNQGLYSSLLGTSSTPYEPSWETIFQHAQLYRDSRRIGRTDGGASSFVRASLPGNWTAAVGSNAQTGVLGSPNIVPPKGVVLMPTIAKVQVFFSLIVRDIYRYSGGRDGVPKPPQTEQVEKGIVRHSPWGQNFAGTDIDYLLHLIYSPVVTLHNPYNVPLEFNDMRVIFTNVPFALQVVRNGVPQTNGFAPLDTMFFNDGSGRNDSGQGYTRFGLNLKANGGTALNPTVGSSRITMLPGEVLTFSPYIDPNATWYSNAGAFSTATAKNLVTLAMDAIPSIPKQATGFNLDWFCPTYNGLRVSSSETANGRTMNRNGCIGVTKDDTFRLNFIPISVPALSKNRYTVEMFTKPSGNSADPHISSGLIDLDYERPDGLREYAIGADKVLSYPASTSQQIRAMDIYTYGDTPVKNMTRCKPFCVLSAQTKTTSGGLSADVRDGATASKPWCFGHGSNATSTQKMLSEHPSTHSHELSFQQIDENTFTEVVQGELSTGRGYAITGLTPNTGNKFGALFEVPHAPLQSLPSLNHSNFGGISALNSRFAQPLGNSWASPAISATEIKQGGSLYTGNNQNISYENVDHSYMANLAMYDRFFFSGLANQMGNFYSTQSKTTTTLATELVDGKYLTDPRVTLRAPSGRPSANFTQAVEQSDAFETIAAWLMMNGAFNVNSTSVTAWKAMLCSIRDERGLYNEINKAQKTTSYKTQARKGLNQTRISRMRLPGSVNDNSIRENYWFASREYTDEQMQILADQIVNQVRARGPFLSMSEFVNRKLTQDDTGLKGAIQEAIDRSNLNNEVARNAQAGYEISMDKVANYRLRNPLAATGPSFQGAPGYLSQADILTVLGNAATVRSDTFTLRGYGEARDAQDNIIATATCEAVVQRVIEFVDPTNRPETAVANLNLVNQAFGRRFAIMSYRWLAREEI